MFIKTLIVSDINIYDVNDKFLESGIYYFIIKDNDNGINNFLTSLFSKGFLFVLKR